MKQDLAIGAVVDDNTGDYLRAGGEKIKGNFDEIYDELGDTSNLHPAGRFKGIVSGVGNTSINADFGDAYHINTAGGVFTVVLPEVTSGDIGKVIKLRDTYNSWGVNNLTLTPTPGTLPINGKTGDTVITLSGSDIELVATSGGWKFKPNVTVDKSTILSVPAQGVNSFVKKLQSGDSELIDSLFTGMFTTGYEPDAFELKVNGVELFYDSLDLPNSEYTSYNVGNPSEELPLNGSNIKIKRTLEIDDVITMRTYKKTVEIGKTELIAFSIRAIDTDLLPEAASLTTEDKDGKIIALDGVSLSSKLDYLLTDLGASASEEIITDRVSVYRGGTLLPRPGEHGYGVIIPDSDPVDPYTYIVDQGKVVGITLSEPLEHRESLTIQWFTGDLFTTLPWDSQEVGVQTILDHVLDLNYVEGEDGIILSNTISYPGQDSSAEPIVNTSPFSKDVNNFRDFLDFIYPIGVLIHNAGNPSNPSDYLNHGVWERFAEGRTIFGFKETIGGNDPDPIFGVNPNFLDGGEPKQLAGNTFGAQSIEIGINNLPELSTAVDAKFLREKDFQDLEEGDVDFSGCISVDDGMDPLNVYSAQQVKINEGVTDPDDISILPPGITVYIWQRIA